MPKIGWKVIGRLPGHELPLRMLKTGFVVQDIDWRVHPDHTEAWADRESVKYGGRQSVYWRQNYERELIRGGLPVWPMLSRDYHVRTIPRKELESAEWAIYRALDHGIRHPTCCAWFAVNHRGDRYFFRQYYQTDMTIGYNCKAIVDRTNEDVVATVADPSIWKRDPTTLQLLSEVYANNGLPLVAADNSRAGYERLTAGFIASIAHYALAQGDPGILGAAVNAPTLTMGDVERLADSPAIWFHPDCAHGTRSLFEECVNFRWKEVAGDPEHRAAPEEFEDKDDEGPDVVRYGCQTAAVCWQAPRSSGSMVNDILLKMLDGVKRAGPRRFR